MEEAPLAATQQDLSSAPTPVVNGRTRRRSIWPLEFYRSGVGKKWVMAITGVMLLGFVFAHMVGNLKLYLGADDMNHYAEGLRGLGEPIAPRSFLLWFLRLGLIGAFLLHIHAAWSLTQMNHRARPDDYAGDREYAAATFASRTMRWSGVIVGFYVLFHLADLTWGWVNPDYVRGDAYGNLVNSFQRVPVAILYVIANVLLGIHIFHGAWSMFQSLGLNNPRFNDWRRKFAQGFAALIVIGNVSFPIAVTLGVVDDVPEQRLVVCEERGQLDAAPCVDAGQEAQEVQA
jgi:succinate dehydrogenase / fumarate reductase cytochrome b subunit